VSQFEHVDRSGVSQYVPPQEWPPSNAWLKSPPASPHSKRHLDWFSRFGTVHARDQQTDRPRCNGNNRPHLMLLIAMRPKSGHLVFEMHSRTDRYTDTHTHTHTSTHTFITMLRMSHPCRKREKETLLAQTDRATRCTSQNFVNCRNRLYNKFTTNRSNGVTGLQLIDLQ